MTDEEFDDLVAAEAYGDEIGKAAAVLDEDRPRWRRSLVALLEDIRADISDVNHEMQKTKTEKGKDWNKRLSEKTTQRAALVQDQMSCQQALARVKALIGGPIMRPDDALRGLADALERFVPPLIAAGVLKTEPFEKAIADAGDPIRREVTNDLVNS